MRDELIKAMRAAYGLQIEHLRQCPRRSVSAVITDLSLNPLAAARNLLPEGCGPCDCDCGVSTLEGGSLTCRAIHAEAAALAYLRDKPSLGYEAYLLTTSPPCKRCLPKIMDSNVKVIVTTDQYPDRDHSQDEWPGTWLVLPYEDCVCPDEGQ